MTTGRTSIDMGRVLETGPDDQKLWLQDHLRDLEAVLEGLEERLLAIETSLGGPLNYIWNVDAQGNLYPVRNGNAPNPSIGTATQAPAVVKVGNNTKVVGYMSHSVGPAYDEGILLSASDDSDDPVKPPAGQLELQGSTVRMFGGALFLQAHQILSEPHHLIIGPTILGSGGRMWTQVLRGPRYIPAIPPEREINPNDSIVHTGVGTGQLVDWVTLNVQADFNQPNDTNISYHAVLGEDNGFAAYFTVRLKHNGLIIDTTQALRNNSTDILFADFTPSSPIVSGDTLSLDIEATGDHPQMEAWVRGSFAASYVQIQQG